MKRSIFADLVIEVQYSIAAMQIAADSKLTVPNDVYGKWDAFIINIENLLSQNNFQIAEQHESNRSDSLSQYYGIYPANAQGEVQYKIIVILRVSDHSLPRGEGHGAKYYERYAQSLKYPEDKEHQDWIFEQILVNDHSVESYQSALKDVKGIIEQWKVAE